MYRTVSIVLFALLAIPALAGMPVDTTENSRKLFTAPSWVAVRSLVVPGWGQLYNGKPIKALVVAGGQIAMGYGIYHQYKKYRENSNLSYEAYADYQRGRGRPGAIYDSLRSADYDGIARFYLNDRNKLIWWSAGAMLLSVYDSFVDAHLQHFDVGPTIGADGEPKVIITVRW